LECSRIAEAGGVEFFWIIQVGGKEKIEGRAVLNLGKEISAGAEGHDKFCARLLLELLRKLGHHELEIGSGSDAKLFLPMGRRAKRSEQECETKGDEVSAALRREIHEVTNPSGVSI
jgi:hypothetical protein